MSFSFFPDHINADRMQVLAPLSRGFNLDNYVVKLEAPSLIAPGTLIPKDRKEQDFYWKNLSPKIKLLKCKPENLIRFSEDNFDHSVWFGPVKMGEFDNISEWIHAQTTGLWSIRMFVDKDERVSDSCPVAFLFEDQKAAVLFKMFNT